MGIDRSLERLKWTMRSPDAVTADEADFDTSSDIDHQIGSCFNNDNGQKQRQTLAEKRDEIIALATEIQTIINKRKRAVLFPHEQVGIFLKRPRTDVYAETESSKSNQATVNNFWTSSSRFIRHPNDRSLPEDHESTSSGSDDTSINVII